MKIFACFPSKYLKAADLHDKHVSATMSHVMLEELHNKDGVELVPILYFQGVPKGMVLNVTNSKTIDALYGDETEAWKGMPIVLFPAMVAFGAETRPGIRMKAPSAAERIRAINGSPNREDLSEHMLDQLVNRESRTRPAEPVTEASMERAREAFLTRKPTPRPKVTPLAESMAIHAENGVVWDETSERLPTKEEKAELTAPDEDGVVWEASGERPLTDEDKVEAFRQSLQRANAAMDERIARGPSKITAKDDGLDIPLALDRRPKRELAVKERLLGDIMHLGTARDCLTWGLEMDRVGAGLAKVDREEISAALLARQTALLDEHVRPAPHQRRLFPIEGGAR